MQHDDECPNCKNGTIEKVDNEFRCRGECGATWRPREVFVTNIPVRAFVEGYVEIAAGITDPVERDNAVRAALLEGRYKQEGQADSIEVDTDCLETGWDLATPLETD